MSRVEADTPLPPSLAMAFAPIHKRALGTAVGLTTGLLLFVVTGFHVIVNPGDGLNLWLLSQYFYGYEVTWRGAVIGLFWGCVTGFVAGWFVAFVRNMVTALWVFAITARVELSQTRDFLDHI